MKNLILSLLLSITLYSCSFGKRSEAMQIHFQYDEVLLYELKSYRDSLNRTLDIEVYGDTLIIVFIHDDDDDPKAYSNKLFTHTTRLYHYLRYVIKVVNNMKGRGGGEYIELYYEVDTLYLYGNYFEHNYRYWKNATFTEAITGKLDTLDIFTKKTILYNF